MITRIPTRSGEGYEVQWYDNKGMYADVVKCDTIEELAQYLARSLWGMPRMDYAPTVWHNGESWCHGEYTEVEV